MPLKRIALFYAFCMVFIGYHASGGTLIKLEKVAVSSVPDNLLPPYLESITVDPAGNVFSFAGKQNGKDTYVVKFDKNLEYIKHFGREGVGPGEFSTLNCDAKDRLSIDPQGNLCVVDYNPRRRILLFDNDGTYKTEYYYERFPLKELRYLYDIKIAGNGAYAAFSWRRDSPAPYGIIFSISPPKILKKHTFTGQAVYQLSKLKHFYGPHAFIETDAKHIVFAHSDIFKVMVFDKSGKHAITIEDKTRTGPFKFSGKEMGYISDVVLAPSEDYTMSYNNLMKELRANKKKFRAWISDIKNNKNVIAAVKLDGERIYVFTVKEDISKTGFCHVEIYNLKGKLVKKGWFEKIPDLICRGFAYYTARDDEDNPLIVKYRLIHD